MLYAGIDLHKNRCQACVLNENGDEVRNMSFPSTERDLLKFFDYLEGKVQVVVEACGIKDNLIDVLIERGFEVKLSDPYKNRLIAEAKIKTDKVDARVLANLLRSEMIYTTYYAPKHIRYLRDLVRLRVYFVRRRTACKNKIHRTLLRKGIEVPYKRPFSNVGLEFLKGGEYESKEIVRDLLEMINFLNLKISKLDEKIKETAYGIREVNLLRTLPGINYFGGLLIYAEIGELSRFKSKKKFAGFTGLVPSTHQSGEKDYKGNITKLGSPYLRWMLIQAAHICVRYDNDIARFYQKVKRKKGSKKAIVTAARKMAVVIYCMLKRGETFRS